MVDQCDRRPKCAPVSFLLFGQYEPCRFIFFFSHVPRFIFFSLKFEVFISYITILYLLDHSYLVQLNLDPASGCFYFIADINPIVEDSFPVWDWLTVPSPTTLMNGSSHLLAFNFFEITRGRPGIVSRYPGPHWSKYHHTSDCSTGSLHVRSRQLRSHVPPLYVYSR